MSVPVAERKESPVQFVTTARSILLETKTFCTKCPKKYAFYGLQHLHSLAEEIFDNCVKANTVYVPEDLGKVDASSYEKKFQLLIDAQASLQAYIGEFNIMIEVMRNNGQLTEQLQNTSFRIIRHTVEEAKMLGALIKRERGIYKKYLSKQEQ